MLKLSACNLLLFNFFSRKVLQDNYYIAKRLCPFKNFFYWKSSFSEEFCAGEVFDISNFLVLPICLKAFTSEAH